MSDDLLRQLSDSEGINNLFQDLLKGQVPAQKRGKRRSKNRQKQPNQQQQNYEAALNEAIEREHRIAKDKLETAKRELKQTYEERIRRLEAIKAETSIIPNSVDEMAKMFIFAELICKPPPGLS